MSVVTEAFCLHDFSGHLFIFFPQNAEVCPVLFLYEQTRKMGIQLLCAYKYNCFAYKKEKKTPSLRKISAFLLKNKEEIKNMDAAMDTYSQILALYHKIDEEQFSVLMFCWTHQRFSCLYKEESLAQQVAK